MPSSHSSPCLPEHKKRQGSRGTATAPTARHYLSAKSSMSAVDLLFTGEFRSGSHGEWSFLGSFPLREHAPQGFQGFPRLFLSKPGNHAGAAARCPGLAARRLGQLGCQPCGEQQPCSQEAEAPHQTALLRCSLQRPHRETEGLDGPSSGQQTTPCRKHCQTTRKGVIQSPLK